MSAINPVGIDMKSFQPVAVQDQIEGHQGTEFEIYEFSNGLERIGQIMKRSEFDQQHGRELRIQLERARSNRRENEIDASYDPSQEGQDPVEPLTCDFCGAETNDPWHTSDATRKHLHQCDVCHDAAHTSRLGNPVAWINGDDVRLEHGCFTDDRALERRWIPLYAASEPQSEAGEEPSGFPGLKFSHDVLGNPVAESALEEALRDEGLDADLIGELDKRAVVRAVMDAASEPKGLTKVMIGKAWRDCGALSDSPPDWALVFAQNIAQALLADRGSEGK